MESRRRERREREQKHIIDYIVLRLMIIINTEVSIYRKTNNLVDIKYLNLINIKYLNLINIKHLKK